jgi:hypothetical protein
MNDNVRRLVAEIHLLDDELRTALYEQKTRVLFDLQGRSIRFTPEAEADHRSRNVGLIPWIRSSDMLNVLSAPAIYVLIVPMAFYDLCLTIYQALCFRLYRIPRVDRSRYIAIDRHHLQYLNSIEKLNCTYCGYANGLLAYAAAITARTEQYWCPIKHAHKLLGVHKRYAKFLDYGDAAGYQRGLEAFREDVRHSSENSAD